MKALLIETKSELVIKTDHKSHYNHKADIIRHIFNQNKLIKHICPKEKRNKGRVHTKLLLQSFD